MAPLPFRLKLLLTTAYFECMLILLYLSGLVYFYMRQHALFMGPIVISTLFYTPYLLSSYWIIFFIRKHFPSREISRSFGRGFKGAIIVTTFLSVLGLVGLIYNIRNWSADDLLASKTTLFLYRGLLLTTALVLLLQAYNSIEGLRLLRIIRKNTRNALIDSF